MVRENDDLAIWLIGLNLGNLFIEPVEVLTMLFARATDIPVTDTSSVVEVRQNLPSISCLRIGDVRPKSAAKHRERGTDIASCSIKHEETSAIASRYPLFKSVHRVVRNLQAALVRLMVAEDVENGEALVLEEQVLQEPEEVGVLHQADVAEQTEVVCVDLHLELAV